MADKNKAEQYREAVGVFGDAETLQGAIDELLTSGFGRIDLSFLANEEAVEEKLGHAYKRTESLEDEPGVPRTVFVSTESIGDAEGALISTPLYVAAVAATGIVVATGGTFAAAVAAAAIAGGLGAAVGAVLAGLVGHHHAEYLNNQLEHGGLLLWVRTCDAEHEKRAQEILEKNSAHDVHIHSVGA